MHTKRCCALALLLALCLAGAAAQAQPRSYYEIFPASFYDDDGDGIGDLPGIRAQLPYLEALGVEGIWLMPIHPSPSYHKYDVTDYYAVDPGYGDLEDFQALSAELHARDMRLLLDMVINHTSRLHPWFESAIGSLAIPPCGAAVCVSDPLCRAHNPYVGYYHFAQQEMPGWHAVGEVASRDWWYMGHFSPDMPDLNLENDALQAELLSIFAFWLDQGADGFRLDAVAHYFEEDVARNNAFVGWLIEELCVMHPDVYVVGEVWKDAGSIERYYESGISSLFNFPFSAAEGAIVKAIREGRGERFALQAAQWHAVVLEHAGAADAPFLSNHDQARIAGTLMRKPELLRMAASMYLTLPGNVFVYYGEEIGMTGSGRDENKRLPMLWDMAGGVGYCLPPPQADQEAAALGSVAEQMDDPHSLLSHYRRLLALRKAYPPLQSGEMAVVETGNPALCAYTLTLDGDTVVVAHNLGDTVAILEVQGELVRLPAMTSYVAGELLE